ncbi:MAG: hypothetical protein ABJA67_14320 [Chthonomonadales bacterium]
MSHLDHRRASDRILTEFIEADIEIAFHLVDMAEDCLRDRDFAGAVRILHDADEVMVDLRRRLDAMGSEKGWPFDPLLGEVRRAIALAKSHAERLTQPPDQAVAPPNPSL